MTRKHFKAIAEILQRFEPEDSEVIQHSIWIDLCSQFATYFLSENPRFDVEEFRKACEWPK